MALNVLTMDGGGSLSLYSLWALQLIERQRPGFLAAVDVFAGTSAGGINALLMAASGSPEVGLQRGIDLWSENPFEPSLMRMLSGALGCISMYGNQGFVDALRPIFLDSTLGDLAARERFVIVPSFQLDGVVEGGVRSWKPVVYHNLGESPDMTLPVLDLSLRTSAAPVFLPIYQGHIDGGTFANNPAMAALARVLAQSLRGDGPGVRAREIRLLSVGTGQTSSYVNVDNAPWGWQQWLFDPKRPLTLVEVLLNAGSMEIDAQCRTILGRTFFRLNPPHEIDGVPLDFDLEDRHLADDTPNFERLKVLLRESVESSPEIQATSGQTPEILRWLDQVGWIDGEDDRDGKAAPAGRKPGGGKQGGGRPGAKKAAPRQRRATKATPG